MTLDHLQTPIYFILAVAEILGFVTASEYAYSKALKNMKTVVQALTQVTAGVAVAIGTIHGLGCNVLEISEMGKYPA